MTAPTEIRQYTAVEREQFLEIWKNSGLKQPEFCQLYGIPPELLNGPMDKKISHRLKLLPVTTSYTPKSITPISSVKLTFPSGVSCQFTGCNDMNPIIQLIKGYERCN